MSFEDLRSKIRGGQEDIVSEIKNTRLQIKNEIEQLSKEDIETMLKYSETTRGLLRGLFGTGISSKEIGKFDTNQGEVTINEYEINSTTSALDEARKKLTENFEEVAKDFDKKYIENGNLISRDFDTNFKVFESGLNSENMHIFLKKMSDMSSTKTNLNKENWENVSLGGLAEEHQNAVNKIYGWTKHYLMPDNIYSSIRGDAIMKDEIKKAHKKQRKKMEPIKNTYQKHLEEMYSAMVDYFQDYLKKHKEKEILIEIDNAKRSAQTKFAGKNPEMIIESDAYFEDAKERIKKMKDFFNGERNNVDAYELILRSYDNEKENIKKLNKNFDKQYNYESSLDGDTQREKIKARFKEIEKHKGKLKMIDISDESREIKDFIKESGKKKLTIWDLFENYKKEEEIEQYYYLENDPNPSIFKRIEDKNFLDYIEKDIKAMAEIAKKQNLSDEDFEEYAKNLENAPEKISIEDLEKEIKDKVESLKNKSDNFNLFDVGDNKKEAEELKAWVIKNINNEDQESLENYINAETRDVKIGYDKIIEFCENILLEKLKGKRWDELGNTPNDFAEKREIVTVNNNYNKQVQDRLKNMKNYIDDARKDIKTWNKIKKEEEEKREHAAKEAKNAIENIPDFDWTNPVKSTLRKQNFDLEWWSIKDLELAVKGIVDTFTQNYDVRSKHRVGDAMSKLLGTKSLYGAHFRGMARDAERSRVDEWKKRMDVCDAPELKDNLYNAEDKEIYKSSMYLLADKGRIPWLDQDLWDITIKMNKKYGGDFIGFGPNHAYKLGMKKDCKEYLEAKKYYEANPPAFHDDMLKAVGDIFGDFDLYRDFRRINENGIDKVKKETESKIKEDINKQPAILGDELGKWIRGVQQYEKGEIQKSELPLIDPGVIRAYLEDTVPSGKSDALSIGFYVMQFVGWGLLDANYIIKYGSETRENRLPILHAFSQLGLNSAQLRKLAMLFCEETKNGKMVGEGNRINPGQTFKIFYDQYLSTTRATKDRIRKSEHKGLWDWWWSKDIVPQSDIDTVIKISTTAWGKEKNDAGFVDNAVAGNKERALNFLLSSDIGDLGESDDKVEDDIISAVTGVKRKLNLTGNSNHRRSKNSAETRLADNTKANRVLIEHLAESAGVSVVGSSVMLGAYRDEEQSSKPVDMSDRLHHSPRFNRFGDTLSESIADTLTIYREIDRDLVDAIVSDFGVENPEQKHYEKYQENMRLSSESREEGAKLDKSNKLISNLHDFAEEENFILDPFRIKDDKGTDFKKFADLKSKATYRYLTEKYPHLDWSEVKGKNYSKGVTRALTRIFEQILIDDEKQGKNGEDKLKKIYKKMGWIAKHKTYGCINGSTEAIKKQRKEIKNIQNVVSEASHVGKKAKDFEKKLIGDGYLIKHAYLSEPDGTESSDPPIIIDDDKKDADILTNGKTIRRYEFIQTGKQIEDSETLIAVFKCVEFADEKQNELVQENKKEFFRNMVQKSGIVKINKDTKSFAEKNLKFTNDELVNLGF